jgi:membrane-bound ClpP family serine protease
MSALAWPMLLLALGLALLAAEVFLPTGGVLGVIALGGVGLSLWLAFRSSNGAGLLILAADFVLTPLTLGLSVYLWPRSPLGGLTLLTAPRPDEIAVSHRGRRLDHLVGRTGTAVTPLRPSGVVVFDGQKLEGLSEYGLIPTGTTVEAVRIRSGRVVVRSAPDPAPGGSSL